MIIRKSIGTTKPGLFSSAKVRQILDGSGAVFNKNSQDIADSNLSSTSSFKYDSPFLGIRSTQQIPVDFSLFENHTFFSSAEVNVNVAFDRIINNYPFDGSRKEVEAFLDSLTGFEKWVFDNFPTNTGYLNFSGSSSPSSQEGNYIKVIDFAGSTFSDISRNNTGDSVLDPGSNSITFEFHLMVPSQANENQVILQKLSGTQQGITIALSQSATTSDCDIIMGVSSGSNIASVSTNIQKGEFNQIVATFDRRVMNNKLRLFVNEELVNESSEIINIGDVGFQYSPLIIASGTSHDRLGQSGSQFLPVETFSGSIDELRIFHDVRSEKQQKIYGKKSIFSTPELKLYFKFNEPTGSIGNNNLILDYSGNALHSRISNFSHSQRSTGSIKNPITFERKNMHPVLFPGYDDVKTLNSRLLASASIYDMGNPNLITKLVPDHYFQEGRVFEGFESEAGTITGEINSTATPGSLDIGSAQLMASLLYVWAKFFDEMKMVIDLFSSTIHVDYDKFNFTADQFLPFLARWYGFEMPAFFTNASIEQFIDAENIGTEFGNNELSLRYIQNQIWRRILTNIGDVIRSKGTLHSIKSLFRSMGIDPDQSFRIREFGGPTVRSLEDSRENRSNIIAMLDFSGSLASNSTPEAVDAFGVHADMPFIKSQYLSSSRTEIGFPPAQGPFVSHDVLYPHGISTNASDGLLTSGSWTIEGQYRWPLALTGSHLSSQSLVRLMTTGALGSGLLLNLTALSGSNLVLHASPSAIKTELIQLELSGVNVMDGKLWNISFGRKRNDEIGSFISSSYFLRAGRSEFGDIVEQHSTGAMFQGSSAASENMFQTITGSINASGSLLVIGSQSIDNSINLLLNNTTDAPEPSRVTDFSGRVSQVRFWSKALEESEWIEHIKNPLSIGVEDPTKNFNFERIQTGSFERLRLDVSIDQPVSRSTSLGNINLFDFSQNKMHISGTGFERDKVILAPQRIFYSQLSPRFDEASTNNKVRVRGFQSFSNVQEYGGAVAPVYNVPQSELPEDDVRFSIDFSIMDALNDDIMKIFSTFDIMDNILGNPELLFSPDYPDLEKLRNVYFNRLTGKIRLQQFFEFFKWFDSVLGIAYMIEQLIPRKTKFLGTNFVIESHVLERPKYEYAYNDIYLGENDRHNLKDTILLQQLNGVVKRY